MESTQTLCVQFKDAVDAGRTDIVCGLISELQKGNRITILQQVLNEQLTENGTLLHYTTKMGQTDTIRALLSGGADPGIQNKEGKLPLELGSADMTSVYNEELLQATAQSNLGRVCQLLVAGVDVNLLDSPESRNTPLHWAVSYANRDMVQCLCSRGANVNVYNNDGLTPLHEAVKRGEASIIEELLLQSVDKSLVILKGEHTGKTAFDLCGDSQHLKQLLKSGPEHLMVPSNGLPINRGMKSAIGSSKQNLVRFDSSASYDNNLADNQDGSSTITSITTNGYDATSCPELATPTFKKHSTFDDGSVPPMRPVVTEEKLYMLWPQPQSIVQGGGKPFGLDKNLTVFIASGPNTNYCQIKEVWNLRRSHFESLGFQLELNVLCSLEMYEKRHVLCHVNSRLCPGTGTYKITISPKQFKIICGNLDSLRNAISTMLQLIQIYTTDKGTFIPTLLIDDWPELHYRGVLLDISQGRIPNIETLKNMIDTLSLLKCNQVYLYSKFKSKTPPEWQVSYSKMEITELDEFCSVRGIQLLPALEVGPKVQFEDLPSIYTTFHSYTSCFSQSQFLSIGPRLSSFVLDATEDVLDVYDGTKFLPLDRQPTLLLCGYPLHDLSTNLLQQLPPQVVFQEFGVKADHDFNGFCSPLADLGINFFVCPGTASWNSLAGCPEATISNIYSSIKCATTQGALGLIVCNWTGKGHFTHQPFSWPGLVTAAGLSWNSETHWDFLHTYLAELINHHVYNDREGVVGQSLIELGRAETYLLRCARNQSGVNVESLPDENGSILFRLLTQPDGVALEHLTADMVQRVNRHVKKCQSILSTMSLTCTQGSEILQELQLAADFQILATKVGRALILSGRKPGQQSGHNVVNFGIANLTPTAKTDLANRLLELLQEYIVVWDHRYLEQRGKQDSLGALHSLLKQLVPDKDPNELLDEQVLKVRS